MGRENCKNRKVHIRGTRGGPKYDSVSTFYELALKTLGGSVKITNKGKYQFHIVSFLCCGLDVAVIREMPIQYNLRVQKYVNHLNKLNKRYFSVSLTNFYVRAYFSKPKVLSEVQIEMQTEN